jgi:hypothetical protein
MLNLLRCMTTPFVDAARPATYRRLLIEGALPSGRGANHAGARAMAQRHAGKASSRTASARDRSGRNKARTAAAPDGSLKERLAALERERDALHAALERERARASKLEEINAAARDRVAWALDSLQSILDIKC